MSRKIEEKPGFSYFMTTPCEAWDALEYHEEWRVYKYPMNKGKLTTALYKQLDWFKTEGSEEEKKSAERMLNQFKEGLGIGGCIHDFWIKAMAERQASLKELKVDAKVRGLKAEQRLTIATVATKQVEEYALSTTLDVHTEQVGEKRKDFTGKNDTDVLSPTKKRIEKRPLYTEPTTDDEEFEEESMFFEPSNITKIQEIVAETIERTIDDWEVKLLKWQQHALKQLINGVQYPSEQSIYNILCASSIFYFQQERRPTYTGFLTTNEIADIRSHVLSKFEIIEIPDRVKEYVKENKKVEEIERFLKRDVGKQVDEKLLIRTFFRLLEECVLWDPLVNLDELTEGIFVVDYIAPLFNRTIHYFNYTTMHSWIDVKSYASELRRGHAVFGEVTSPKRQNDSHKVNWDIYRGATHAKDDIDYDINQRGKELQSHEKKRIVTIVSGYKMSVCVMELYSPGIYLFVEVASCNIPKNVRDLEQIMIIYQILMSVRHNAVDILGEKFCTTPLQTDYKEWTRPTVSPQ
ncbi:14522_t:CDS:2 [Funneliformis geosporum]|uniref:9633_t:CDS:1 n=1 Tax=Funneliformis geosporum TaxID=1117311 RepID=A0A9W4WKI3_9GLOM|nr:9633_t:CDS:2 [Funneliformis geosporum]CAI2188843.1 14522_t:CDS:2 [Funneliformis geosporum]